MANNNRLTTFGLLSNTMDPLTKAITLDQASVLAAKKDMLTLKEELELEIAKHPKEVSTLLKQQGTIIKKIDSLESAQYSFRFGEDNDGEDLSSIQQDLYVELTRLELIKKAITDKESELNETKELLNKVDEVLAKIALVLPETEKVLVQRKSSPPKKSK
jgi:hypothetical protein